VTFADLQRAVKKLQPIEDESGDRIFRVYCCGQLIGKTKTSRKQGRGSDVGPRILAAIPAQLNITRGLWLEIAACHKSRPEYLEARGHTGHR